MKVYVTASCGSDNLMHNNSVNCVSQEGGAQDEISSDHRVSHASYRFFVIRRNMGDRAGTAQHLHNN